MVCEAKQWNSGGGVSLNGPNANTGLPTQMSTDWIKYVADKLIETNIPEKVAIGMMLQNPANFSKIRKFITAINKSTGDINVLALRPF